MGRGGLERTAGNKFAWYAPGQGMGANGASDGAAAGDP